MFVDRRLTRMSMPFNSRVYGKQPERKSALNESFMQLSGRANAAHASKGTESAISSAARAAQQQLSTRVAEIQAKSREQMAASSAAILTPPVPNDAVVSARASRETMHSATQMGDTTANAALVAIQQQLNAAQHAGNRFAASGARRLGNGATLTAPPSGSSGGAAGVSMATLGMPKDASGTASASTTTAVTDLQSQYSGLVTAMGQLSSIGTTMAPITNVMSGFSGLGQTLQSFSSDERLGLGIQPGLPWTQWYSTQASTWMRGLGVDQAWLAANQSKLLFQSGKDPIGAASPTTSSSSTTSSATSTSAAASSATTSSATSSTTAVSSSGSSSTAASSLASLLASVRAASATTAPSSLSGGLFKTIPVEFTHVHLDAARGRLLVGGHRAMPSATLFVPPSTSTSSSSTTSSSVAGGVTASTGVSSVVPATTTTTTGGTTSVKRPANAWEPVLFALPLPDASLVESLWPNVAAPDLVAQRISGSTTPNLLTPLRTAATASSGTSTTTPSTSVVGWDSSGWITTLLTAYSGYSIQLAEWTIGADGRSWVLLNLFSPDPSLMPTVLLVRVNEDGSQDTSVPITTLASFLLSTSSAKGTGLAMRWNAAAQLGIVSLMTIPVDSSGTTQPSLEIGSLALLTQTGQILQTLALPDSTIARSIVWSPDGSAVYVIGETITSWYPRMVQLTILAYRVAFDSTVNQTQCLAISSFGTSGQMGVANTTALLGAQWIASLGSTSGAVGTVGSTTTVGAVVGPLLSIPAMSPTPDRDSASVSWITVDPTTGASQTIPILGTTVGLTPIFAQLAGQTLRIVGQRRRISYDVNSGDAWVASRTVSAELLSPATSATTGPADDTVVTTFPSASGDGGAIASHFAVDPTSLLLYVVGSMQIVKTAAFAREGMVVASLLL